MLCISCLPAPVLAKNLGGLELQALEGLRCKVWGEGVRVIGFSSCEGWIILEDILDLGVLKDNVFGSPSQGQLKSMFVDAGTRDFPARFTAECPLDTFFDFNL